MNFYKVHMKRQDSAFVFTELLQKLLKVMFSNGTKLEIKWIQYFLSHVSKGHITEMIAVE